MAKQLKAALPFVLLLFLLMGCDNAPPLERTLDSQAASIMGEFYTEDPEAIQFPVKILFAVDCSSSMEVSDPPVEGAPNGRRIEAIRRFIDRYNTAQYPSASFSIVLWAGSPFAVTQNGDARNGFTRDRVEIDRVLGSVMNDTYTDYIGALGEIQNIIQSDIWQVNDSGLGEHRLPRTKYIICFFSDGMAQGEGGSQEDTDIFTEIDELVTMAEENDVGQLMFHSFFLSSFFDPAYNANPPDVVVRDYAISTLRGMAERGSGTYTELARPTDIDFINIVDMRLTTEYKVKFVVAYNYNVRPVGDWIEVDSDGDGLTDEQEATYGTDPTAYDTDNDGYGDYFEVKSQSATDRGFPDPLVADSDCIPGAQGEWPDQDSDGLSDCEEWLKNTRRFVADHDGDAIPDGIELAVGTNPFWPEYSENSDYDELNDRLEVQLHTNVLSSDPRLQRDYKYLYTIEDHGLVDPWLEPDIPPGVRKYGITISNIALLNTTGTTPNSRYPLAAGENFIRLYIAEVPEDMPNTPPIFRMAEFRVDFNQAGRVVQLQANDFELLE